MDSRTRLHLALNHQEADHVPLDIGGTHLSSIHVQAYRRLRNYLGLAVRETRLMDVFQQIAEVDDDLRVLWGVDVRYVAPNDASTYRRTMIDMGEYVGFYDEWGIGWKMPKEGGWYFDQFFHPLAEAQTLTDIERYPFPDPEDTSRYAGLAERLHHAAREERLGVFLSCMCSGILELAAWMRGFENFYADLVVNEKLAVGLMRRILEIKLRYWEVALREAGENVDVVAEADDLGAQSRPLISPATYRRLIKPLHQELFSFIHARTQAKLFFHSCGAIRPLIPDLIEAGIEVLNPVQVSAVGMDSAELKREFGKELVFWGGGIDTQHVLTAGTPEQVKNDVRRRIEDLAPGGGFVFAPVHNIQGNVPPENIRAMWEAWKVYGHYSKTFQVVS